MAVAPVGKNPLSPLPWMIPDRSSPSRVRFAASRPGLLRADPKGWLLTRGKGGIGPWGARASKRMIKDIIIHIVGARAEREPFGHTGRLEPQPRGAVTRRAVAQRRSRASGLTRPWRRLSGVLILVLGCFVVGPFPRSAAVWRKSVCFQFFTYKEGFGFAFCRGGGLAPPPLPVVSLLFSASYPQARRSYYLFFNYLFFNYLFFILVL